MVEYSKSEEAAKNAEKRRRIMELLNHAVRAELTVLHEQDAFYVEDLIEKLEGSMRELDEEKAETTQTRAQENRNPNSNTSNTRPTHKSKAQTVASVPLMPTKNEDLNSCVRTKWSDDEPLQLL